MKEKKMRMEIRLSEKDKKKIERYAKKCGVPVSEYVRQCALGFSPRQALTDDFYDLYSRLCDVCNLVEPRIIKDFVGRRSSHEMGSFLSSATKAKEWSVMRHGNHRLLARKEPFAGSARLCGQPGKNNGTERAGVRSAANASLCRRQAEDRRLRLRYRLELSETESL